MIEIRQATIGDLPALEAGALEFYSKSRFLRGFDISRFCSLWSGLLASGDGVIFLAVDDGGPVGALGGMRYADPYSSALVAVEFFWFMREQHRGSGLSLYRKFEEWAKSSGCAEVRMVHLSDVMPERVKSVYQRLGFEQAETHYIKEI